MPGKPVGIAYAEIDLDSTKLEQGLKRTHDALISGTIKVEDAYKSLGIKSDQVYNQMRANAVAAVDFIKNKTLSSTEEIVRAQKAAADKIKAINEEQYGKQISFLDSLKKNWMALAATAAVVIYAVERITTFGRNIASATNDIERHSKILGLTTNEYQKLSYACKMSDLQIEEFNIAIGIFSTKIEDARKGTGDAGKYLRAMGIDIDSLAWKSKTLSEKIGEIAEQFKYWYDGERKIAIARELFGRSGDKLIDFLNRGKSGIQELCKEAERLGIIIGPGLIKKGTELDDHFKRMEARWTAIKSVVIPIISEALEWVNMFIEAGKGFYKWITMGVEALGKMAEKMGVIKSAEEKTMGLAISHGAGYVSIYGKKEPPIIVDEKLLEKTLEEEAKAWGAYADEQIAALAKLNEYKNEATKTDLDRQKWAEEKIIEGEKEATQTVIEAWGAVYSIDEEENKKWIEMHEYADKKILEGEKEATQEVIDAWGAVYEVMANQELERIKKEEEAAKKEGEIFKEAARGIYNSFVDMFEDIFDKGVSSFKKLVENIFSLFKRVLAQMATLAIAQPIIVPIVSTVGSTLGVSETATAAVLKEMGISGTSVASGIAGTTGVEGIGTGLLKGFGMEGLGNLIGNIQTSTALYAAQGISTVFGVEAGRVVGQGIADISSAAFGGWAAGIGTFIIDMLKGKGFLDSLIQAAATGLGAWGGAAAGAAIGSIIPGIGTLIGGILGGILGGAFGNWLGGLFGSDKEHKFTLTELVSPTINAAVFDVEKGFEELKWQAAGESWYAPIANAYSAVIETVQQSFNGMVFDFASKLPKEMQTQILNELAATDFGAIQLAVSAGEWKVSEAKDAITALAQSYANALAAKLGTIYANALADFIIEKGPGGLFADTSAWGVLTDRVQQNIKNMFAGIAETIKGGDIEKGITEINEIGEVISNIGQAIAPISEIIATKDMTEYELELRNINKQFDTYAAVLKEAGVDLEKYTDLEIARSIEIGKLIEQEQTQMRVGILESQISRAEQLENQRRNIEIQTMEAAGDAAGALAAKRADELATMDACTASMARLLYATQDVTNAREALAEVQKGAVDAIQPIIDKFRDIATNLRAFREQLGTSTLGGLSPEMQYAATRAELIGAHFESVQTATERFLTAAMPHAITREDYLRDVAFARRTIEIQENAAVEEANRWAEILNVMISTGEAVDRLAKAIADQAAALAALIPRQPSMFGPYVGPWEGYDIEGNLHPSDWFQIPGNFASGGKHSGGWRVVGEQGPELEYTGPSNIVPLKDADVVLEIKELRNDLRKANYVIAKNTEKLARIYDRWDSDGLPAERTVT